MRGVHPVLRSSRAQRVLLDMGLNKVPPGRTIAQSLFHVLAPAGRSDQDFENLCINQQCNVLQWLEVLAEHQEREWRVRSRAPAETLS
jgi:hypothetical protein